MARKLFFSLKNYFIDRTISESKDVFEKIKMDLVYNLFVIFSVVYLFGFIRIVAQGYWYVFSIRLVGLLFIGSFFYALKKTQDYKVPGIIWVLTVLFFGIQSLLINSGALTFANLGLSFFNMAVVIILLNERLQVFFFIYYALFITFGLCISFGIIEHLNVSSFLLHDKQFGNGNLAFAITPIIFLMYVLYIFVKYEYKINKELGQQIDSVRQEEHKVALANESVQKNVQLASKIQQALLPKLEIYTGLVEDSFVLLKPQNELSGDFYWASKYGNCFYGAIIDSAENNISGAMLSSVYYDALNSAIKRKDLTSLGDIISSLNEDVKVKADLKNLKRDIQISLIKIDVETNKLYFSSEKNSLYFAKKGKKVIDEYKSQQFYSEDNTIQNKEVVIDFDKGDTLYMLSDGFAANYRGFDNVKFKESVLKAYLTGIKNQPMKIQKTLLENKLALWIGDDLQTDDVCILGIKL